MRLRSCFLIWLLGCSIPLSLFGAETAGFPEAKVLPWDGHKAAFSLTFDDSDPSHLDVAVPELNKRKMRGTFFLIANKTDRKDEWRKLTALGHELANHSLDHKRAVELKPGEEESQISGAKNVLQKEFGVPFLTFAYPFTDVTPVLKDWVGKTNLLGRGGYGNYVMTPDLEPDWLNLPSRTTMTDLKFPVYQQWIDEDLAQGGWTVLMIHGLEGTPWGWQPITRQDFTGILDALRSKDIWVDTFLRVGAYFRAQKVFEKAVPADSGFQRTWNWVVPDFFPSDVVLKMRLGTPEEKDPGLELWQGKRKIVQDAEGYYAVTFSLATLTLRVVPKR